MAATINPMTYQTIINNIQLMTLNDPTAPASTTQEYSIYQQMINNLAIPTWENERGTLWNELWVDVKDYSVGGFTTLQPGQGDIALPTAFKFIGGGYIRLKMPGSTSSNPIIQTLPVRMLPEIELDPKQNKREFFIYGNPSTGYFIKLGWIVQTGAAEVGATLNFRYYKFANSMVNLTDIPEMSDPNFIIYKVSAQVSANNFNMNLYQIMEDKANYSLLNMRMANDMASNFMDDYVKDIDKLTGAHNTVPNRMNSGYWVGNLGP